MLIQCVSKRRRGSLLLEVVIAAALFGTAAVALGRLAQASSALSVKGDQRLSAQLTAENALQLLHLAEFDALETDSIAIQKSTSQQSTWNVIIEIDDCQIAGRDAAHFAVTVSQPSTNTRIVQLHDWRISDTARLEETGAVQ